MKAQIFGFPIKHHNPTQAMVLKALVNYDCPCEGCKKFFARKVRSSNEIFRDIAKLSMTDPKDEAKRIALFQELYDNTDLLTQ